MIRYLIDTDIASFVLKNYNADLRRRLLSLPPADWGISAISCAELLFGLEDLPLFHAKRVKVHEFLQSANTLYWPVEAASDYANIRHLTRKQPLQDRDMLIAAHAIALDATLVTNNTRHFSRMGSGLRYENWLE